MAYYVIKAMGNHAAITSRAKDGIQKIVLKYHSNQNLLFERYVVISGQISLQNIV